MAEVFDVHMRHFIGMLGMEDATISRHYAMRRLFKITDDLNYPSVEHPILLGEYKEVGKCEVTLFHLAYTQGVFDIKKKYDNHLKKSNMHTPEYLDDWKDAHLLGRYPTKPVNLLEIPRIILDNFHINIDKYYFANRGLEVKHFIDAIHWRDFFKPKYAIEIGCGRGPRVLAMNMVGINTDGIELSEYAVNHSFLPNKIRQGDIIKGIALPDIPDLVIVYDLLEHIEYNKIDFVIETLKTITSKYILISIPVIGDPNLLNDLTHKIKETKEWWIKKFTDKGLKQIEVPNHFLYKGQLMIFEK